MNIVKVDGMPRLHTTPLPVISYKQDGNVVVEIDDEIEKRFKLIFTTIQAIRITTADCYRLPNGTTFLPNTVMEVEGSDWIEELKANLARSDETATFMNKARHFLVPCQDDFLEVISWTIAWSELAESGDKSR